MTALVTLAAVVLALVLLGQIRLGAAVDYTAQGLCVRVKAGPLRIQAYPRPPRPEKPQKRKKKKKIALSAAATLTAAQAISLALRLAAGFLKANSQSNSGAKAPARQKEAV